jgi:hypothetical protein
MTTACILLFVIGLLGAFDIAWFHMRAAHLTERPESRVEVWFHVARGVLYAAQFTVVPNLRLNGAWYAVFVALFVADVAVALGDVLAEPRSRCSLGGLPGGEYFMHIVLSVLVGAYLDQVVTGSARWHASATGVVFEPHAPLALRVALAVMGVGALLVAAAEAATLVERALPPPPPIHVSVRLRASPEALWDFTQDHRVHPAWDHRFTRIVMLADVIQTGTPMLYEKTLLGVTIRGWGRYKLHKPCRQSTFEFGSNDPRSLIRRGVGLWLYRPRQGGGTEFSTSYTYEVRWGVFGRVFDRLVFRPLFQWETERSFRRLATRYFPVGASAVAGARGRKPERLARLVREAAA